MAGRVKAVDETGNVLLVVVFKEMSNWIISCLFTWCCDGPEGGGKVEGSVIERTGGGSAGKVLANVH